MFNLQRVVFQRTNRPESAVKQLQHQQQQKMTSRFNTDTYNDIYNIYVYVFCIYIAFRPKLERAQRDDNGLVNEH